MTDANAHVARAIRDELCKLGLVSEERAAGLEKAMREGTLKTEDWYRAIEASLPAQEGAPHAADQPK